ncbi:MAG: type II secretion system F family protein [Acidimicrobiales bacterium]
MIVALCCGAGLGAGLWLVARGIAPPRPTLAVTLARLRQAPEPERPAPDEEADGFTARLGRPVARALLGTGGGALVWPAVRRDLAVLGRSPERQLAEQVTLAVVGLLLVPATAGLLWVAGLDLPLALPIWGSLILATAGFVVPVLGLHADAEARRRDLRHALGSFLDLVTIDLAAGGGIETALTDAASVGDGWAYDQLRQALEEARLARETPWAALGRLGDDLGVAELHELAGSVGLAGSEGARVRTSLTAKAASLRAHQLAEAESAAQAATEKMSLPVVALFGGFLIFIAYPAIEHVLGGL